MRANQVAIIIDADIARSSGLTEHPISSASRTILETIRRQGHKIALCPKLKQEWRTHQSRFAISWLSSMTAARKVVLIEENNNISECIESLNISDAIKNIAIKDAHLIDGALICNKIIASNDSTARSAFSVISKHKKQIETILWLNAVTDREFIEREGMNFSKIPNNYQLKSYASNVT